MSLFFILTAFLPLVILLDDFKYITYTSVFKLKNSRSNTFLHTGSLTYQSGSHQQAVTGFMDQTDQNAYWQILKADGYETTRGYIAFYVFLVCPYNVML
ncbi:hypothetical protein HZS_187 [Henneguya salminicola]|nr:hypothetical protein HZS_187 [Henneguya salminicola]